MKSRISSFLAATVLLWTITLPAIAQTNRSIRITGITITSYGSLRLDLVLSDDLLFWVEHSTDLVSWKRFPDLRPGQIIPDAVARSPAGPLTLFFPSASVPSGSAHFYRCQILDERTVIQQSSPQPMMRSSNQPAPPKPAVASLVQAGTMVLRVR